MMKIKNLLSKISNMLLYGGLTKEQYQSVKANIEESNRHIWQASYIVLSLIFLSFFIISFFLDYYIEIRYFALGICLYTITILIMGYTLFKNRQYLSFIFRFVTYLALLGYGAYAGTFTEGRSSIAFFATILIISLVGLERPIIISPFVLVMSISYGLIDLLLNDKLPHNALMSNFINTILYSVLAVIINIYLSKIKYAQVYLNKEIAHERDTDQLSNIFTKPAGIVRINSYMEKNSETGIMLFIDIDDFKKINDSFGHDYGDQIITKVSQKIKDTFNDKTIISRFGGDEFMVFMPDTINLEEATNKAIELLMIHNDITYPNGLQSFYISIGIAIREASDNNYRDLLNKADLALYKAKSNGKNQYQVYDSSLKKESL